MKNDKKNESPFSLDLFKKRIINTANTIIKNMDPEVRAKQNDKFLKRIIKNGKNTHNR